METAFLITSGATVGLVLGSFITMLSYRLPRGLSITLPPSQCPNCQHRLTIPDLVPVFSWFFHRGTCRHCNIKIGARYVIIEIITAFLVTATFYVIGFHYALLPALLSIIGGMTWAVMKWEK